MTDSDVRRKKVNDARELELLAIRSIMKTENGRSFMWRCLQNCNTHGDTFSKDTHQHAKNAGKRSHGLWLDAEIREADVDRYFLMLKEHGDEI